MVIEIQRISRNDAFSSGMLFVDGKYFCQTLEREELRRVRLASAELGKVGDIIVGSDIVEGRMRDPGNLYNVLLGKIRLAAKDGEVSLKI